jgi:hypothetical protein
MHGRPARRGELSGARSWVAAFGPQKRSPPDVNLKAGSRNYVERAALPLPIQPRVTSSAMKQQQDRAGPSTSDFRYSRYDGAIRAKLGEALREQHDLMAPMPQGLGELLGRLTAGVGVRDTNRARLYAAVDECVAAMVRAASRKPRETGEA